MATPKTRANTLLTKLGFDDKDSKTPEHDIIMLWLDSNMQSIINSLVKVAVLSPEEIALHQDHADKYIGSSIDNTNSQIVGVKKNILSCDDGSDYSKVVGKENKRVYESQLDNLNAYLDKLVKWTGLNEPPMLPEPAVERKVWELPISSDSSGKFIVGFIDMYVACKVPYLATNRYYDTAHDAGKNFIPKWIIDYRPMNLYFEVKTKISSVGETIRQIRTYQQYAKGQFILVSPDETYKKTFEEQGITFLKCEQAKTSQPKGNSQQALF